MDGPAVIPLIAQVVVQGAGAVYDCVAEQVASAENEAVTLQAKPVELNPVKE